MYRTINPFGSNNTAFPLNQLSKMIILSSTLAALPGHAAIDKKDLVIDRGDIAINNIGSKLSAASIAKDDREKKDAPAVSDKVQKIDAQLVDLAKRQDHLDVVIVLSEQPQRSAIEGVKRKYRDRLDKQAKIVQNILSEYTPKESLQDKKDEVAQSKLMEQYISEDHRNTIKEANAVRDDLLSQMRKAVGDHASNVAKDSQERLESTLRKYGVEVKSRTSVVNSLSARIASKDLDAIANLNGVAEIFYDAPGKPELEDQGVSLGVNRWWNAGLDGGIWDVGVLDSGVLETHSALSGHTIQENYSVNDYHGTGVACMYGSTDETHRGLAFGLDRILVDNAGFVSTSMEGADWMIRGANDDPEVINYSWGNGLASSNDWHNFSRFVDAVVGDYNTTWAKSAGNNGYDSDPTMTVPANNYNGITVANMYDGDTVTRSDDVIWRTSSRGPTANGRKKPDLSAPGQRTMTCNASGGFSNLGGTSSAAPKVGAASLLLNDGGNWDPKAVKAVLINTADSWEDNNTRTSSDDGPVSGREWNRTYGWGYLDLAHAHFHRNDFFVSTLAPRGRSGDYKLYKGRVYNGDKATLVWERDVSYRTDGSGDPATPTSFRDLSDLDLRMYNEFTNATVSSDTTSIDNVHQVAANGRADAVVKVYSYSSSFDGVNSERYALATEENFSEASGPDLSISFSSPTSVSLNSIFTVTATIRNVGDLDAHNNRVTLNIPSRYTLVSGTRTQTVRRIANGNNTVTIRWRVRAPLFPTSGLFSVSTRNYSYGETFRDSSSSRRIATRLF